MTGDFSPLGFAIAGRSGSRSCVGDLVTYTCTLPAVSHRWRIPTFGLQQLDVIITRANSVFSDSRISISITEDEGGANPITTELSVVLFSGLDGANIICRDGNEFLFQIQEATVMVAGELDSYITQTYYTLCHPKPWSCLNYC